MCAVTQTPGPICLSLPPMSAIDNTRDAIQRSSDELKTVRDLTTEEPSKFGQEPGDRAETENEPKAGFQITTPNEGVNLLFHSVLC